MKTIKQLLFLLSVCWFIPYIGHADTGHGQVYVFKFVADKDKFYVPWNGNGENLQKLYITIDQYREEITSGNMTVQVDGYCAAVHDTKAALQLAKIRSNRVKSELIVHKGLREEHFLTQNHATAWGNERNVVVVTLRLPAKKEESQPPSIPEPEKQTEPVVEPEPTPQPGTMEEMTPLPVKQALTWSKFSLRANLLHWATLTPDLGFEWRPSERIGVVMHGTWTHWDWKGGERHLRLWKIEPEVRYYMGATRNGYLGAAFRTGQFNVKPGGTGYQSDFTGGGLTGGYQLHLNRRIALDFSLGAGYSYLKSYQKYTYIHGININKEKRNRGYWSIDHAGVTLILKMVK